MMNIEPISTDFQPSDIIRCHDPATGDYLGDVLVDSPEQVRLVVEQARDAQREWAKTSFRERRKVLGYILEHVLKHADELSEVVVRDSGKTRENAMLGEIWPVCEKLRSTIANGEKHLKPERVSPGLLVHKRAKIEFHPLGVIGIICPWNYPLQNVLGPTIPALMAGNGVVVKVSEWTSWSAARIQAIFDEAFDRAGIPRSLVKLICGYGETGAALVSSGADKIVFTGSMRNGRKVIEESAKTLTPVILELGGKDALIVCDDAELEQAVHASLAGVFIASGQNCLAAERILVFDAVYDDFVSRVSQQVRQLRQGPPLEGETVDVGAMTMPGQVAIVQELVDDAVNNGATVVCGGRRRPGSGHFFEPTILTDVTPKMKILNEETFGPVMVILRVKDEEEAIRVANSTQFGLASTVMTRDAKRAKRIADRLVAGATCVNDFGLTYMAQELPFGGVRSSGFGRLNGREGLRACTNIKAVLTDRFPIHQPAKLFPVAPGDYETAHQTIQMIYSSGVPAKLSHLWQLIKLWRSS